MSIVLYRWPASPADGLPLTAACLQAEAALRLAGLEFSVRECSSMGASPTGVLPALDTGGEVLPPPPACDAAAAGGRDLAAAAAIVQAVAARARLDDKLSAAQRAEAAAFAALLASALGPAAARSTWAESAGFAAFKKAAYAGRLPFPLSVAVPWAQRAEMLRALGPAAAGAGDGGAAAARTYARAGAALRSLGDRLAGGGGGGGRFFFGGAQPSSLDALLLGHLAFLRRSPCAAPALREEAGRQPRLCAYVDALLEEYMAAPAPSEQDQQQQRQQQQQQRQRQDGSDAGSDAGGGGGGGAGWSDAAQGRASSSRNAARGAAAAEESTRLSRGSMLWLAGAGAALTAYVTLGGHYNQQLFVQDDGGDDDGEEELEVDDGGGDDDDGGGGAE